MLSDLIRGAVATLAAGEHGRVRGARDSSPVGARAAQSSPEKPTVDSWQLCEVVFRDLTARLERPPESGPVHVGEHPVSTWTGAVAKGGKHDGMECSKRFSTEYWKPLARLLRTSSRISGFDPLSQRFPMATDRLRHSSRADATCDGRSVLSTLTYWKSPSSSGPGEMLAHLFRDVGLRSAIAEVPHGYRT